MANNASVGLDGSSLLLTASPSLADEILLKEPRSRIREFITLVRVMCDFIRSFRVLHFVGPDGYHRSRYSYELQHIEVTR
jgi:hypothetical protein